MAETKRTIFGCIVDYVRSLFKGAAAPTPSEADRPAIAPAMAAPRETSDVANTSLVQALQVEQVDKVEQDVAPAVLATTNQNELLQVAQTIAPESVATRRMLASRLNAVSKLNAPARNGQRNSKKSVTGAKGKQQITSSKKKLPVAQPWIKARHMATNPRPMATVIDLNKVRADRMAAQVQRKAA